MVILANYSGRKTQLWSIRDQIFREEIWQDCQKIHRCLTDFHITRHSFCYNDTESCQNFLQANYGGRRNDIQQKAIQWINLLSDCRTRNARRWQQTREQSSWQWQLAGGYWFWERSYKSPVLNIIASSRAVPLFCSYCMLLLNKFSLIIEHRIVGCLEACTKNCYAIPYDISMCMQLHCKNSKLI